MPSKNISALAVVSFLASLSALTPVPAAGKATGTPHAVAGRSQAGSASALAVNGHYEKALSLRRLGYPDQALVEFLKATQENPRLYNAFYEQAVIFRDRGFLKLAESSLEQALSSQPDFQKGRILLATVRLQQGEFQEAASDLSKLLGISPPKPIVALSDKTKDEESNQAQHILPPSVMQVPHASLALPPLSAMKPGTIIFDDSRPQASTTSGAPSAPVAQSPEASRPQGVADALKGIPGLDPHASTTANGETQQALPPSAMKATRTVKLKDLGQLQNILKPNQAAVAISPKKGRKSIFSMFNPLSLFASNDSGAKTLSGHAPANMHRVKAKKVNDNFDTVAQVQPEPKAKRKPGRSWFSRWFGKPEEQAPLPIALRQDEAVPAQAAKTSVAPHMVPAVQAKPQPAVSVTLPTKPAPYVAAQAAPAGREAGRVSANAASGGVPMRYLNVSRKRASEYDEEKAIAYAGGDAWTKRMREYALHGTHGLKNGEASMFSEETGDATMFLADGNVVTRHVLPARDPEEIANMRRPDINNPKDLKYNLSLLGKVLPKDKVEASSAGTSGVTLDDLKKTQSGVLDWVKNMFSPQGASRQSGS